MLEAALQNFGGGFWPFVVAVGAALVAAVASLALNDRRVGFWVGVVTLALALVVFVLGDVTALRWLTTAPDPASGVASATAAGARSASVAKTAFVCGVFPALVGAMAVLGASRRRLGPMSMRAPRPYSPARKPVMIAALALAVAGLAITVTFALLPLTRRGAGREQAKLGVSLLEQAEWDRGCASIEEARATGFEGFGVPAWTGALRQCFELRFEDALRHEGDDRRTRLERLRGAELAPTQRDRDRVEEELARAH